MPTSTGFQLIGTSLVGVVIFGEWSTIMEKLLGAGGILILIVGIMLTSVTDKPLVAQGTPQKKLPTILMLLMTTLGYVVYMAIPRGLNHSGLAIFFPEAIGILLAVLVYVFVTDQQRIIKEPVDWSSPWAPFLTLVPFRRMVSIQPLWFLSWLWSSQRCWG